MSRRYSNQFGDARFPRKNKRTKHTGKIRAVFCLYVLIAGRIVGLDFRVIPLLLFSRMPSFEFSFEWTCRVFKTQGDFKFAQTSGNK